MGDTTGQFFGSATPSWGGAAPSSALNEAEAKFKLINPALEKAQWPKSRIRLEYKITDGRINLRGNKAVREKPLFADYVLFSGPADTPMAVIEAKRPSEPLAAGIQQAMKYARMLGAPFAYASNGTAFYEHDFLTGKERTLAPEAFPAPSALEARVRVARHPTPMQDALQAEPFCQSQGREPRYYQRQAVNAVLEAFGAGQKRLLLVMATGTGKTYTAFQIVWRLLQTRLIKRVLYLADRNVLVDQTIAGDFAPLKNVIHKIASQSEDPARLYAYRIFFSLYQQLVSPEDPRRFERLFPRDFFDLVIVDECHRGSADANSQWRTILEYFEPAVQLGMTATPKENPEISTSDYFGKALYSYSLAQGIDDDFLAPFRVRRYLLNTSQGWRPLKNQVDVRGEPIPDRMYTDNDFGRSIVLEDRTREVAQQITDFLTATRQRMAKTIVFCPTTDAALTMRNALADLNADMLKTYPDYVVRITGDDAEGKAQLDYFRSVANPTPVIATTSELLSTGVDIKLVKVIVIDRTVHSMTLFKQMLGRGTRLDVENVKTDFTLLDFRGVFLQFSDPAWDGPELTDDGFDDRPPPTGGGHSTPFSRTSPHTPPPHRPHVSRDGCAVVTLGTSIQLLDSDGRVIQQLPTAEYAVLCVKRLWPSAGDFRRDWLRNPREARIRNLLEHDGLDLGALKFEQGKTAYDDFDFINGLIYGIEAKTRKARADALAPRLPEIFPALGDKARGTLALLLAHYVEYGPDDLHDRNTFKLPSFCAIGTPLAIARAFGGEKPLNDALCEFLATLYSETP